MATHYLDLSGLKCPMPVIYARRQLKNLSIGDQLEMRVTDPEAPKDMEYLCQQTGQHLLKADVQANGFLIIIEKKQ